MRRASGREWSVQTYDDPLNLVLALYIRDRLGLCPTGADVPRLRPEVRAVPFEVSATQAAAEWEAIWNTMLTDRGAGGLRPFAPTMFKGLHEYQALQAPWAWLYEEACRWQDEVSAARASEFPPGWSLPIDRVVEEIEARLERALEPFQLTINVLPVDGVWWHQVDSAVVLISSQLCHDETVAELVLQTVIAPIA